MKHKLAVPRTLILLGVLLMAATLTAGAGAFLKFGDIEGEATDKDHKSWITLDSLSTTMKVSTPSTSASAGATRHRGDVILDDITISKHVDKASPKLAEAVCKGKVIPKVEIHVTASADTPYYRYEMTNVRVTSYSVSAGESAGDRPTENITLNFGKIKVDYDQQGMRSKSGGNAETTWKVEKGEK